MKRWTAIGLFHIIQRCRKCETWVKREIDYVALGKAEPALSTYKIEEKIKLVEEETSTATTEIVKVERFPS